MSLADNLLYQAEELSLGSLRGSLTTLVLASNGFSRIPNTFQHSFDVLRKLDLSSNRLVIIPTSFLSSTPQLEHLNLDNNLVENIILEVEIVDTTQHTTNILFQPLTTSFRHLSLLGNKLRCDCKVGDTWASFLYSPSCFRVFG